MEKRPLFFVDEVNERWLYTLDFIFKNRGLKYYLTEDFNSFARSESPKINLGIIPKDDALNWRHANVLDQDILYEGKIEKKDDRGIEAFAFNGLHDPLSSIFFVLSRMEEYLIKDRDKHERFSAFSSYQYQFGWLEKCMCDRWAEWLIQEWGSIMGIDFKMSCPQTKIIPTFDIDNAFAYKLKVGPRKLMSVARDITKFDRDRLTERKRVLSDELPDPYDTYEKILQVAEHFDVRVFWLVGDYATYDRNISVDIEEHQKLIIRMAEKTKIGLHPSYRSNQAVNHLWQEKDALQKILGLDFKVTTARQHFLKLALPETYKNYLKHGFEEDYTMGFAEHIGFRSGTARMHYWFDLEKNSRTRLQIHPFSYMDGSLLEYMKLNPVEAEERIKGLYLEVKRYGGDFIFLWHNETIGNYGKWKGWSEVLDFTLDLKKNIK